MIIKEIEFKSYDANKHSFVKTSSLMKQFQQMAREDLDNVGFTYESMRELEMIFVLIKIGINVKKPLKLYKTYKFQTISRKISGVKFIRDFYVYENNELIAEAVSAWVLINFTTRKPLRPISLSNKIIHDNSRQPDIELPSAIKLDEKFNLESKFNVKYSHLDENNHLNNCNYADLIEDSIPEEIHNKNTYISHLELNFVNEAVYKNTLSLKLKNQGNMQFSAYAYNETLKKECFTANFTYSEL